MEIAGTPNIAWIAGSPKADPDSILKSAKTIYPYFEANYKRWLPTDPQAAILDFGCGHGGFVGYLGELGFRNVTAFDLDTRCYEFVKQNYTCTAVHTLNPRQFLEQNTGRYDLIIVRHVAYYFPRHEIQEWFQSLRNALSPNGKIILEVVNAAGISGLWPYFNDPYIQIVFSEHLLRTLTINVGLKLHFLGEPEIPGSGIRYRGWQTARRLWSHILRLIYILERGMDPQNPTIISKNLLLVAAS